MQSYLIVLHFIAICSQGCHNGGTCMDVDTCKCSSGWKGHDCKTRNNLYSNI